MSAQPPFPPYPGASDPIQPQYSQQGAYPQQQGPAFSPDGRFVWNGQQWVPVPGGGGGGSAATKIVLASCLTLLVLAVVVIGVLTVVGKTVSNVFSNVSTTFEPSTVIHLLW